MQQITCNCVYVTITDNFSAYLATLEKKNNIIIIITIKVREYCDSWENIFIFLR